jgi:hypothetical protein
MRKATAICVVLILLLSYTASYAVTPQARKAAADQLLSSHPSVKFYHESGRLSRLYGGPFGSGAGPEEAAEQFRSRYAAIFGVDPSELLPENPISTNGNTQPVMYLEGENRYKFTLVYYSQYKDGIPVYRADLRLLVRNEPGYPLVLASSALRELGDFDVDQSKMSISPVAVQQAFAARNPQYREFTEAKTVIWAGFDDEKVEPSLGVFFIASDSTPAHEKFRYIIEPSSGEVLFQENMIIDVDVAGNVDGYATENFLAEQCGNEIPLDMPWARVYINGGNAAFADSAGHYVIPNSGSIPVSVISYVRGRWFQVWNNAGTESYLTQTVIPPGPGNFLHNTSNTEYARAEINGYIHANLVRDFTLKYNPLYPTIYNQTDWPVYVNDNTLYCPGNAWYDGVSITFCRAASGYPNTAFSTIVHHEYGHHLVEMAGNGQEEYGEGMGDVMGLLITDNPGAAWGFYGPCNQALRNAVNSIQYPCSGEIHYCGQLLSGCVWETRNELLITNPTTYRSIIANLAINAMLLHTGYQITPSITIDYLTLDDDDGNIGNGTPHHSEICTGFGEHNMDCPPLDLLSFSYPNGLPDLIHPFGDTCRVNVTAGGGIPQPNTGQLHYNSGSGWIMVPMTQISPNVYNAIFPAITCRTGVSFYFSAQTTAGYTVDDPDGAPTAYYSTSSGTGMTTLYQDDFSTNLGWSGLGGTGEWSISSATGGAGSDTHGGPDPAIDHSPTSDNRVIGNDNTSGTGGDYGANITATQWVTSPVINCAGQTNIALSFWRWLGVEQGVYDDAFLQAYNGASWVTLYQNPTDSSIDESAWSQQKYNVSTYADNNANFRIRFGLGVSDGSWQWCGWNIDDIRVTTVQCDTFRTGFIAGVISDTQGPVANAIVHAVSGGDHGWDTTAANGSYVMEVFQKTYSVSATHIDHRDTTVTGVVVTSNNTTTLNVTMQRLAGAVKGTVTSGASQPVADVRVVAVGSGKEDTTDIAGFYRINGLIDGIFSISFTNPDYRDTTITGVNVTPGDTTMANVIMQQRPGWVEGIVRDSSGAPIESVMVIINNVTLGASNLKLMTPEDNDLILAVDSLITGPDGYYSSRLAALSYNITFRKNDYEDTTAAGVPVTPNDTTNVSPALRRYNHPPVITSSSAADAMEDIPFSYIAAASDSDGVIPAIVFDNFPGWLNTIGDTISGVPLEGNGSTAFRIIASDGFKADTQIVAVTVTAVNDPPVITSAESDTATEHQQFSYTTTAVDPDNPSPSFSFVGFPSWVTPMGATISGAPPEGAADTSFLAIASDGALADSQLVQIIVLHLDDPPVITSSSTATATEDIPFVYIAASYDPEGAAVSIALDQLPAWMTATGDTILGMPLEGFADTTFRIVASDGALNDTMIVAVDVVPVNDAPTMTSVDTAIAVEDMLFSYTGTASDPDGTTPTIGFANFPSWMAPAGSSISGTPLDGYGDTSFNVIASDGILADTLVVSVEMLPVNDSPVITSAAGDTATEGELMTYICTASDIDGPALAITFTDYPSWLAPLGDTLSGTPPVGASDTSFQAIASDGLLADTLTVGVEIRLANQPPSVTSAAVDTAEIGVAFYYLATANDPDGTIPMIGFGHYPEWMSIAGDAISGMPPAGSVDTSFMVTAYDGQLYDSLVVLVTMFGGCHYIPGDINGNGSANGIDVTFGVTYFKGGPSPANACDCRPDVPLYPFYASGDVNGNCAFNGIDVTFYVAYLKGLQPELGWCQDCQPSGPVTAPPAGLETSKER